MNEIVCTMGDVVNCIPALYRLREEKLPIKTSLYVSRLAKAVDVEYEIYIEEEKKLLDIYAEKDEKDEYVRIPVEGTNDFKIHILDMNSFNMDQEEIFSVEVFLPVSRLSFESIAELKISPNDLDALMYLLEDDISDLE